MALMKKRPTTQQVARQRAEVIMKVRCGLMSASQAAEQLGISRKSYYKWEQRALSAMLAGLTDQPPGRPSRPVDTKKQALEEQLQQVRRDNELLKHKMALKDVLTELKLEPGMDRGEKK
jgi:transposase